MRTEEQQQLRDVLRGMFGDLSTERHIRAVVDGTQAWNEALWKELVRFGLLGLHVDTSWGGPSGSYADLAVAMEEAGSALAPVPLLSSSCAIALIAQCPEDAAERLLPELVSGRLRGTVAVADSAGWTRPFAGASRTSTTVSGTKSYVLDGTIADVFAVSAVVDGAPSVVVVPSDAPGVSVCQVESLDLTRRLATVTFDESPGSVLARGHDAERAVARGMDVAAVLVAAEQVGGAQRCLDDAVSYAKLREQFGRPIGSFQAIKHKCADMLLLVEGARSLAHAAAETLDTDAWTTEDTSLSARTAKAYCSDAFVACAQQNIQIHGGIGFTWEHSAHLYMRRAKSTEVLFGSPGEHRAAVMDVVESGLSRT